MPFSRRHCWRDQGKSQTAYVRTHRNNTDFALATTYSRGEIVRLWRSFKASKDFQGHFKSDRKCVTKNSSASSTVIYKNGIHFFWEYFIHLMQMRQCRWIWDRPPPLSAARLYQVRSTRLVLPCQYLLKTIPLRTPYITRYLNWPWLKTIGLDNTKFTVNYFSRTKQIWVCWQIRS